MELPETIGLRNLLDRYLAGNESLDAVAPRFVSLLGAYWEANYQATRRGAPTVADFEPPNLTQEQRRRMQELHQAVLDCLPIPAVEWLPLDGGGAD
ncbi:MAG: hypothetical protein ACYC3F_01000 [Gemmatimonadaceae bacterium]